MNLLNNMSLDQFQELEAFIGVRKELIQAHKLKKIYWECTSQCQLDCSRCQEKCKVPSERKDMPLSVFLKVLDEFNGWDHFHRPFIHMIGSEPLLRADLEQCGMEFYKRGYQWGLSTNGILLSPGRLYSLVDSGLRSVSLKLNGLADVHNWYWGTPEAFDKAIQALSAVAVYDILASEVHTCVNSKNLKELPLLKELLMKLNVRNWRLYTRIYETVVDSKESDLTKEEYLEFLNFVKRERELGEIQVNVWCEGFMGSYELKLKDTPFFCMAGIEKVAIGADGSISGCPKLERDFIEGNVYTDSFVEVWNNGFSYLRNKEWTRFGICENCMFFKWCQGNAMHLRYGKKRELKFCPVMEFDL